MADSPGPDRLRRALREGDSPISALLVRAAALAVVVELGSGMATLVAASFRASLRAALSGEGADPLRVPIEVATLAGPLLLSAAAVAVVVALAQTGGVVTLRAQGRARGRGRGADGRRIYEALRGAALSLAVPGAALWVLATAGPSLSAAIGRGEGGLRLAGGIAERMLVASLAVIGAAAVVDVAAQRAAWKRRWTLSPSETRRERRDLEGDPHVKAARRRAHEDLLRQDP